MVHNLGEKAVRGVSEAKILLATGCQFCVVRVLHLERKEADKKANM